VANLGPVCDLLERAGVHPPFALQVALVLDHLLEGGIDAITEVGEVVVRFRRAKLIPPVLIELCVQRTGEAPRGMLAALCFAASLYPRRAYQLEKAELESRGGSFFAFFSAVEAGAPGGSHAPAAGFEFPPFGADEVARYLSDLTGLKPDTLAGDEGAERKAAASLYLRTCDRDLLARMYAQWREDGDFIRCLRLYFPSPPSFLARLDQSGERPEWAQVSSRLAALLPDVDRAYHERAIILEKALWKEARRWTEAGLIFDAAQIFWERQWAKLSSGFPYYAFLCRFPHWWKQCLRRFHFSNLAQIHIEDEDLEAGLGDQAEHELERDSLRSLREGYRFIRTTFFARPESRQGPADAWRRNEALRHVLDALWYLRLEDQLGDEDLSPLRVAEIQGRFEGEFTPALVNNLNHRLHRRLLAYRLARFNQWRNSQIRYARREMLLPRRAGDSEKKEKRSGDNYPLEYPLEKEPGVRTIASICRLTPPSGTLLWVYTAHVFLHSVVDAQHPDPWPLERYLTELWYWVADPLFDDAIEAGIQAGRRADVLGKRAMVRAPFRELIAAFRKIRNVNEIRSYLAGRDLSVYSESGRDLLREVLGPGLGAWSEGALRAYRRLAPQHWLIPVWYVLFVEQCHPGNVPSRLLADNDEAESIVRLAESMVAEATRVKLQQLAPASVAASAMRTQP
jgi:hypothetical protein